MPVALDAANRLTAVIPDACAGKRLDLALAHVFAEHSRHRLQGWIRDSRVSLDGHCVVDPTKKVWGGEQVNLEPGPIAGATTDAPEDIDLRIVFEDASLLVVDKPAGLVVHPGSGNWTGTLLNALLHHVPGNQALPRAGIVHRLDKDTSGLLVVAKTAIVQTNLVRQLQARTVKRDYRALVHGLVEADGVVDAPIGRDPKVRTRMAVVAAGREARTRYRVVDRFLACTLLEASLDTGRTHQIRVHMRSIGHPLVGDPLYGRRSADGTTGLATFPRQALHAARLALEHPVSGESLRWSAPLPRDMKTLLAQQAPR